MDFLKGALFNIKWHYSRVIPKVFGKSLKIQGCGLHNVADLVFPAEKAGNPQNRVKSAGRD